MIDIDIFVPNLCQLQQRSAISDLSFQEKHFNDHQTIGESKFHFINANNEQYCGPIFQDD